MKITAALKGWFAVEFGYPQPVSHQVRDAGGDLEFAADTEKRSGARDYHETLEHFFPYDDLRENPGNTGERKYAAPETMPLAVDIDTPKLVV